MGESAVQNTLLELSSALGSIFYIFTRGIMIILSLAYSQRTVMPFFTYSIPPRGRCRGLVDGTNPPHPLRDIPPDNDENIAV